MTGEQMKRGIELLSNADSLRKKLDEYVLLKPGHGTKEIVLLGEPYQYEKDRYHRVEVPLSDTIRRYAFRVWKKEQTARYNAMVRELNQLGVSSDHKLRDLPEAQP